MLDPSTKNSYFSVLTDISNLLCCNLLTRKQLSTSNEYYTLTASSKKSLYLIISYFYCFPLFSSKYLDYSDWRQARQAYILIIKDLHLSNEAIGKIDMLKTVWI